MAPIKSTLSRSVAKLLGVYRERDLSLRGFTQESKFINVEGLAGASGGTLVASNPGGMELRHFPSGPSTFSYTSAGSSDVVHVFIVAGGGGGGFGGGGGGGIAYAYNLPIPSSPSSYTVAIGGGGASRANGGDSTFAGHPVGTITAVGGGGNIPPQGSNTNQRYGGPGGSGGGGGHGGTEPVYSGGTATQPSQNPGYTWGGGALYQYGQPGGRGNDTSPTCCEGGGGGGASGPSPLTAPLPATFRESGTYNGPQASLNIPGDANGGGTGGNGITLGWIPTSLGDSGYFGGGGPGSYCAPNSAGSEGGSGAGECPSTPRAASNGTANTGGGGGGGNATATSGGTGIVLVYYPAR